MLNNWIKNVLNLIYPRQCVLCGANGSQDRDLCADCYLELPVNQSACQVCAIPLPDTDEKQALICGQCQLQGRYFDRCQSALIYESPIDKLIHQLKFQHKLYLATLFGNLMADTLESDQQVCSDRPDCIIPVPLHASRLRGRGYNQALELARPIAKRLKLPLLFNACVRHKHTLPQADLPAEDRLNNIKGSFFVTSELSAKHVAIVDDVMTTGSTVDVLAETLKQSGVKTVDVWVCARAKRHSDSGHYM